MRAFLLAAGLLGLGACCACPAPPRQEERAFGPLWTEFWTFPSAESRPIYPIRTYPGDRPEAHGSSIPSHHH